MAARRRCAYKLFGTDGQTDRQTDRQTDGQTEKFNTISLRFTGDKYKSDNTGNMLHGYHLIINYQVSIIQNIGTRVTRPNILVFLTNKRS